MTKSRNKWAAVGAALLSTWSSGCAVDNLNAPWKWTEPEIADVHPVRKSRADEAAEAFDRERNRAQFLAARSSWRQGDYEACRASLEKVLLRDPNHREALLLSADVALETDQPEEAVAALRRLAALDPHDIESAYRLGLALEATGDFDEALPYLRQAAAGDPTNSKYADARDQAEAHVGERTQLAAEQPTDDRQAAAVATAVADWEAGRDGDAAVRVAAVLAERPEHVDANILQAEIDLAAGKQADALARMERLAEQNPTNAQVFRAFGYLCEAVGEANRAAHCFAEAQRFDGTTDAVKPDTPLAAAQPEITQAAFTNVAQPVEALTTVEDATLTPPEVPSLAVVDGRYDDLLSEGQSLLNAKKFTAARTPLRAAVQRSEEPKQAVAAAVAALKAEQPELSYELAALGVEHFPASAGLRQVQGMAAYRMRRYADAEAALRRSLDLDNSQALSYFLLGSALERLGQPEAGERYRSEAARLDSRYALRK